MTEQEQDICKLLLWACWRGIPASYKVKYARNIWDQFADNIRSAAYTSSLPKFFETLCRKLAIEIHREDVSLVNMAMNIEDQRGALRAFREQTTPMVLFIRLKNEERKEEFKEKEKHENTRATGRHNSPLFD